MWEPALKLNEYPAMGGRIVVKGTRIEPETLIVDAALGATPDETHESFPTIPVETIKKILAFAHAEQSLR